MIVLLIELFYLYIQSKVLSSAIYKTTKVPIVAHHMRYIAYNEVSLCYHIKEL